MELAAAAAHARRINSILPCSPCGLCTVPLYLRYGVGTYAGHRKKGGNMFGKCLERVPLIRVPCDRLADLSSSLEYVEANMIV